MENELNRVLQYLQVYTEATKVSLEALDIK